MFGINLHFVGKGGGPNDSKIAGRPGARKKRRRYGRFEQLERREMMAADLGELEPLAMAASASVNDDAIATAQNLGRVQGVRTVTEWVGVGDARDFYRFVLDEQDEVALRLDQLAADLDLYLYNSSGQEIASSWRGGSAVENIVRTLGAGTYYVRVVRFGQVESDYRLTVDVDVANETIATSNNLGVVNGTRVFTDWVGSGDRNDYFRFQVSQQSYATLRLDQLSADVDLYLYNSAGAEIARSWRGGSHIEQIQRGLAAGTYFARVNGVGQSDYRLALTVEQSGFQIALSMTGLTTSQQAIINQAARRWEQVIIGDLPGATYNGQYVDDLLIGVRLQAIDDVGTTARAGWDAIRSGSLPYHGYIEFDPADIGVMERTGQLFGVVMHEIGHVLGVGTLWRSRGLLSGAGTSDPRFVGAQATAAYNQIFGTLAAGVPVENIGGPLTLEKHFRESILGNELMTGWVEAVMPLSRITIGSLADIGYSVNFAAADPYTRTLSAMAIASSSQASTTGSMQLSPYAAAAVGDWPAYDLARNLAAFPVVSSFGNRTNGVTRQAADASNGIVGSQNMQLSIARSAAMASWSVEPEFADFGNDDSNVQACGAFETAWDELAADLLTAARA
jgi:hypothetical protein